MFAGNVYVKMHYQKWCLDGEVVDKFGRFATDRIRKRTTRAGHAHPLDIGIHSRPIEVEV
jgi:hypothetical protein